MPLNLIDTTTNHGSYIGDPAPTAFGKVNANDTFLQSIADAAKLTADNALPKSGGTVNGNITVNGAISTTGQMQTAAYRCRSGSAGSFGANTFNMMWGTGAMALWVDTSNLGNIAIAASDDRIKDEESIEYIEDGDIEIVMSCRPCSWQYKEGLIWDDGGVRHRSFIAPQLEDVSPMLVQGERGAVDDKGGIIPQGLDMPALISVLWGALREEITHRRLLEARVAALEVAA